METLSVIARKEEEQEQQRIKFYFGGFKRCPYCKNYKFSRVEHPRGAKNGKLFGSDSYTCLENSCRWQCTFEWDQSHESYYYEAQALGWKSPVKDQSANEETVVLRLVKRSYVYANKPRSDEIKTKMIAINLNDGSQTLLNPENPKKQKYTPSNESVLRVAQRHKNNSHPSPY